MLGRLRCAEVVVAPKGSGSDNVLRQRREAMRAARISLKLLPLALVLLSARM
jgi:hypothetical protein